MVFKLPSDNRTDYIKRIVGLPGDELQVIDGILHVNGEPAARVRVEDFYDDDGTTNGSLARYRETLPDGKSFDVLDLSAHGSLDNTQVYKVPEGHVFAMGDNRDNSLDSRVDGVGFIPDREPDRSSRDHLLLDQRQCPALGDLEVAGHDPLSAGCFDLID